MSKKPAPPDPIDIAVSEAAQLLGTQPPRAAARAAEVLRVRPGHPQAALILGAARCRVGNLEGALQVLIPLAKAQPGWAPASYEVGVALGLAGRREQALAWLRRAVQLKADIGEAWRLIADHLRALGDPVGADAAMANHEAISTRDPRLAAPAAALLANRVADAEAMLQRHLAQNPDDVYALRMQADVAVRLRRSSTAGQLLARCLELAPDFRTARCDYARVLSRLNRPRDALTEAERLLEAEPRNAAYLELKAELLTGLGDYDGADALFAEILADRPDIAHYWVRRGHLLRKRGLRDEAVDAYRRAIDLAPGLGEAHWGLADMRAVRFDEADVDALRRFLARPDLSDSDRLHLRFALGRALEDAGAYEESFRHYAEGNRLRRAAQPYDARQLTEWVRRSIETFTREFFSERQDWGSPSPDPIFFVGVPGSGSTLVEQILTSHSAVEGTPELPDVPALAWSLRTRNGATPGRNYQEAVAEAGADELRALGERYLEQTRAYRRTGAPHFIDRLPSNWEHVALIHLMLPNARIVDVRRDAMDSCFTCFKRHFAGGQVFSYDLRDVGRYYRDYVALMAHFDEVLPGRVHRVDWRALEENTESEVRRLLEYCGLPFEDACLRSGESIQSGATPGSEPGADPIGQWRHYERWLGPLRNELG